MSQDSYTGDVFEPWTQHLYSYCGNNPTNYTDPTGHAPKYISDSEYNTQRNNLINQKSKAERLVDSWASRVGSYSRLLNQHAGSTNYVSQMIASYSENMFNYAQKELRRNYDKLKSIKAEIAELDKANEMSRKVDNQKKKPVYKNELDAAEGFLKAEIPNTVNDGDERTAFITGATGYEVDPITGEISGYRGYELSRTFKGTTGFGNRKFIGMEAISHGILLGKTGVGKSMVHTHPGTPGSGNHVGFSSEDWWLIVGYDALTGGCGNIYMGDPDQMGKIYKLDIMGAPIVPNTGNPLVEGTY